MRLLCVAKLPSAAAVIEIFITVWLSTGAAAGFLATVIFPPLSRRIGLRKTGAAAIAYQLSWLVVGAGPTAACAVAGRRCGGPRVLITGVALSRTGLWAFDLAVGQLMQEEARESS